VWDTNGEKTPRKETKSKKALEKEERPGGAGSEKTPGTEENFQLVGELKKVKVRKTKG